MSTITIDIITFLIAIIFGWPLASPFMEKIFTWPLFRYFNYKEWYGEKAEQKAAHHTNIILFLILSIVVILITIIYS